MAGVCLVEDRSIIEYPSGEYSFSPSVCYPEYLWGEDEVSKSENKVYDLVRQCLYMYGLDKENFGKKEWNPLKGMVKQDDVVLIKPNWVENKNKNKDVDDNLACLVTNPSVIRAIIDYVLIAMRDTGRIIIGDAPMQGCNLQEVFRIAGYNQLFEFYYNKGIKIEIADLRKYSVSAIHSGVMSKPEMIEGGSDSVCIELGKESIHAEKDGRVSGYKVSDYQMEDTRRYHNGGSHRYEVSRIPMEADVIINVPKPKTHRLAGMTAACKNFVGVTYEKACLPHRIEGDKKHGGDAYLRKSIWKEWMHVFDEKRTRYSVYGKYRRARFFDWCRKGCYVIGALTSRDKYRIGSWYGNDTIWRTVVDLNYLLLYADKEGKMCETSQRRIFTIGDMIVCGEKEGPIGPSPKCLGMIMMSENALMFDRVMCEIMGFSADKIPMFCCPAVYKRFGYDSACSLEKERITSNIEEIDGKRIEEFRGKDEWKFEAHSCWKWHIEK